MTGPGRLTARQLDATAAKLTALAEELRADPLAALVAFCQEDDSRFFELQWHSLAYRAGDEWAPGWECSLFIGAGWTHPKAETSAGSAWLKSVERELPDAARGLVALLDGVRRPPAG